MKKILFAIITAAALAACQPQSSVNAYLDGNGDCIFENNVVSFRINGAANSVVTSGMEAILKGVVDKREVVKDRRSAVASSLNDGGSALLVDGGLVFPAANFESFEVVEKTDKYVTFTLNYPQWQVGDDGVSLIRTVTLHDNSLYCEVTDIYKSTAQGDPVTVVAGFAKRSVVNHETGEDYLIGWQSLPAEDGFYGVGIVMPMSDNLVFDGPEDSAVSVYDTKYGRRVEYAVGSCWSKSSIDSFEGWAKKVRL